MLMITGKTYAAKELLKEFGGVWNGGMRCWTMTEEQWAELKAKSTPSWGRSRARLVADLAAKPALAAASHDAIYNESADGYNPHR